MSNVTANTLLALLALLVNVITIGTVIYNAATRLAKIEVKVDTMWAYSMRRAVMDSVTSGIATIDSPITFRAETLEALNPIKDRLRAFGRKHRGESTLDKLIELEAAFGSDLLRTFCFPLLAQPGTCLLAALQVATGEPLELPDVTGPPG